MVPYKEVQASNALLDESTAPRVAVFVGGTSGIGKLTVRALAATGASVRIYIVGRKSAEERTRAFIEELKAINPKAEAIWIEGEVSLLAEVKRVCETIKSKESRVDLLFLSTGYAPFRGREETSEGLDIVQCLEYYTRMLFILHLLPLLEQAETPRVISVLAGWVVKPSIDPDDLDLKKPGSYGNMKAHTNYAVMGTTTLEMLANGHPHVTFIHSWPGIVNTGNVWRGADPNSFMGWVIWLFLDPLIRLLTFSDEESGQRHLFQCTSAAFGGRGVPWEGKPGVNSNGKEADGLFLVGYKCDSRANTKVMSILREKAQGKIWDHTQEVLRPYL